MKFFEVEPDVGISISGETEVDNESGSIKSDKLQVTIEDWFGDALLTSFPVYLFSQRLADDAISHRLTGVEFRPVDVEVSEDVEEDVRNALPQFLWGVITGEKGADFFMNQKRNLVVSETALALLKHHGVPGALIREC